MAVREYRSNVFSMLLEEKKYALEVYNALNSSSYQDLESVKIQRLENGIVISVRNDASFFIDGQLNIYEHQSTFNPNMTIRELIYYVDMIKPMVMNSDLYNRKPIVIPTPHFCVFYNGVEKRQKEETFYLSKLFEKKVENPELEVCCKMINLNRDVNPEFLKQCKILDDYSTFIDCVNRNRVIGMDYTDAIEEAIKKCISENILKEFLLARGNEVLEVMTLDYTWERREQLIRRDERIEGYNRHLIEQICKKLAKQKSVSEIAEALEEDVNTMQKYVDVIVKYAPDYDMDKIIEELRL